MAPSIDGVLIGYKYESARPGDERPEILTEQMEWLPEPGIVPLTIDLAAFFGRVLDDARRSALA